MARGGRAAQRLGWTALVPGAREAGTTSRVLRCSPGRCYYDSGLIPVPWYLYRGGPLELQ